MHEPRRMDRPEPGHWRMRLIKGGPLVAACICWVHTEVELDEPGNLMERSPFLAAFINGKPVALSEVWERRGEAIDEATYKFMLADAAWAAKHAPDEPIAEPRRPIDLFSVKPPF